MKYAEFLQRTALSKTQLLAFSYGTLIEDPPEHLSRTPTPPMLMVDRVLDLSRDPSNKYILAEQDVRIDDWFFGCHFLTDPVQPGCLGVDAIWQLLGIYATLCGATGTGRALGCKEVDFFGQIRPYNRIVRYEVKIQRLQQMPGTLNPAVIIGSGKVFVDNELIYTISHAKVGFFIGIAYRNYPFAGKNALGGTKSRVDEYNTLIERGDPEVNAPETSLSIH